MARQILRIWILPTFLLFPQSLLQSASHRLLLFRKESALLRVNRKYRHLRRKFDKDLWDKEVVAKSLLARAIHGLVYSLIVLSMFTFLYLAYLFAVTWDYQYIAAAFLCLIGIYPTQSYRMGARGTRLGDLLTVFPHALSSGDIRRLVGIVLTIYGAAASVFGSALLVVKPYGLEAEVVNAWGVSVTNVALLAIIFATSLFFIASFSVPLRVSEQLSTQKVNRMFRVLLVVTYFSIIVSVNLIFYLVMSPVMASLANALAVIVFLFIVVRARKYLSS